MQYLISKQLRSSIKILPPIIEIDPVFLKDNPKQITVIDGM